jgi:DNA helicase-2/ATP-dependent DNA helicase PcrA
MTDEFLAASGRDPCAALAEFLEFARGGVAVGHNVSYDLNLLNCQLGRLGLPRWQPVSMYDTLDMARRFYRYQRYTLGHLSRELGLARQPSHRAIDDAETTWLLVRRMIPSVHHLEPRRREVVGRLLPEFAGLQERFRKWAGLLEQERPAVVLRAVLTESGLERYWRNQPDGARRWANLEELVSLFERYDDRALPPREAVLQIANMVALGNEADRYAGREDRVAILTAHQAKGLEFDTVFIAGATDSLFPSRHSVREGRLDEEHRLFYVALTRARRQVFISYHERDARTYPQSPSRFITLIPEGLRHGGDEQAS